EEVIEALADFNLLVGDWRGIGQPKRGSQQGAWQETATCLWELSPAASGLRWKADAGKLWASLLISYDPQSKTYSVTLSPHDGSSRSFTGTIEQNKLVVESPADKSGEVQRLTWLILNENRLTVLLEKRLESQAFYNRVAEIAFQRQGTKLEASEGNGPECVVTGGKGTISVSYKGKTYFVCCTGCRDAFNDDPEAVLAAYEARKKDKK
ncbi:MAG: YHS domain-containing protein, partial [Planctomycetaceae bacterium]